MQAAGASCCTDLNNHEALKDIQLLSWPCSQDHISPGDHHDDPYHQEMWRPSCMPTEPWHLGHHLLVSRLVMACRGRPAHPGGKAAIAACAAGTAAQNSDMPGRDGHTAADLASMSGHGRLSTAPSAACETAVRASSTPAYRQL